MGVVTVERDGHLLMVGINRPDAYNLWNLDVIQEVSRAYRLLGDDRELRVGVLFGHGERFTAGLDLPSVAPLVASADVAAILPADGYDPWNFFGDPRATSRLHHQRADGRAARGRLVSSVLRLSSPRKLPARSWASTSEEPRSRSRSQRKESL